MKFSQARELNRPELVIGRRHDDWLTANDHQVYSDAALAFAVQQLSKKHDRVRLGSFSPSALGGCLRSQQFVYAGMDKLDHDAGGAARMANGTMVHLRWQMAGLTEGWLIKAEVPAINKEYGLIGTMDGLCYDDSILEIKSINGYGYSRVTTFGPLEEHQLQMAGYMLCTGLERGVFIYEHKDSQDYREIVVQADEMPIALAMKRATELREKSNARELYEPLSKCMDREGWRYNTCQFRDRCLSIYNWDEIS